MQTVLEFCYPLPGKTPRFQRRRAPFRETTEEDEEVNALEETDIVLSDRVSLPSSARKLARDLAAAGVPANEEAAKKLAQRRGSHDGQMIAISTTLSTKHSGQSINYLLGAAVGEVSVE